MCTRRIAQLSLVIGVLMPTGCSSNSGYDELTVPLEAQPKGEQFVLGRKILSESQKAYANVESYVGTIEVSATSGYPSGVSSSEPRKFDVQFRSPHNLRMDGEDSNNDPFSIRVEPQSTTIEWNGEVQRHSSAEEALYAFSGVTLDGSSVLPGCLLDIAWRNEEPFSPKDKSFLSAWATKALLDGTAKIENTECHRIVCERDTVTWTIYVDTESKLLRQVGYEVSEAQMRQLRTHGAGGGASGRVISMKSSQSFRIAQVVWKKESADDLTNPP